MFTNIQVEDLVFLPHEYLLFLDTTGRGAAVFICRHVFEEKMTWRARGIQNGGRHNYLHVGVIIVGFAIYLFR